MMDESVKAYVTKADNSFIKVKLLDVSFKFELLALGFQTDHSNGDELIRSVSGNEEKAKVFEQLNLLEVCFSDGKEWCPAEVFEYMRDIDLLSGSFRRISWIEPKKYHIVKL